MNKICVGLGFGDEGKGRVVDYLCDTSRTTPLVVRFSGGQQAGHNVVRNGVQHIFSNFGSGTLRGFPTYWSKYCTVDPMAVITELNVLHLKGIEPKLYIDYRCPVTTPYDIVSNRYDKVNDMHGTCGSGVGKTLQRERDFYHLSFGDLFYPKIVEIKLKAIAEYHKESTTWQDTVEMLKEFESCRKIITNCINIEKSDDSILKDYTDIVFEGSQGLLLDQHIGFFPNVTPSNTGTKNVYEMTQGCPTKYLVTRCYQTRHGNGFMTNEDLPLELINNVMETNIKNLFQGEFRTSVLDLDLLLYAVEKDEGLKSRKNNLVITCTDHIRENDFQYTLSGKLVKCRDKKEFIFGVSDALKTKIDIEELLYSDSVSGDIKHWFE